MPLPGWNRGFAGGYVSTYLRVPVFTAHEITAGVSSLLICAAQGNQLDLLTAQLNLELIAGQ